MDFLHQNYLTLSLLTTLIVSIFLGPLAVSYSAMFFEKKGRVQNTKNGTVIIIPLIILFMIVFAFKEYSSYPSSVALLILTILSIPMAILGKFHDNGKLKSKKVKYALKSVLIAIPILALPHIWLGVDIIIEKIILVLASLIFVTIFSITERDDKYTIMQTLFVCLAGALVVPKMAPLFMLVLFAALGYTHILLKSFKLKVEIGSMGRYFLGYILAGLITISLVFDPVGTAGVSFFAMMMLFICDLGFVAITKLNQGKSPFVLGAKKDYIFDRMEKVGISSKKALVILGGFNTIMLLGVVVFSNRIVYIVPIVGLLLFAGLNYYVKNYGYLTKSRKEVDSAKK